jgi:hypothetical protein
LYYLYKIIFHDKVPKKSRISKNPLEKSVQKLVLLWRLCLTCIHTPKQTNSQFQCIDKVSTAKSSCYPYHNTKPYWVKEKNCINHSHPMSTIISHIQKPYYSCRDKANSSCLLAAPVISKSSKYWAICVSNKYNLNARMREREPRASQLDPQLKQAQAVAKLSKVSAKAGGPMDWNEPSKWWLLLYKAWLK